MSLYADLVNHTQMNYSTRYDLYSIGETVYALSNKEPLPYEEQIKVLADKIKEADCVIVGGASGLSAAGGGYFYYDDTPSYRKYFGKYTEKYGFKGTFAGSFYRLADPAEKWRYLATFLHTTQTAQIHKPYLNLESY